MLRRKPWAMFAIIAGNAEGCLQKTAGAYRADAGKRASKAPSVVRGASSSGVGGEIAYGGS
jgi:hypothetical protein